MSLCVQLKSFKTLNEDKPNYVRLEFRGRVQYSAIKSQSTYYQDINESFKWNIGTQPLQRGETLLVELMIRNRWQADKCIGAYRLGMQQVLDKGYNQIHDSLIREEDNSPAGADIDFVVFHDQIGETSRTAEYHAGESNQGQNKFTSALRVCQRTFTQNRISSAIKQAIDKISNKEKNDFHQDLALKHGEIKSLLSKITSQRREAEDFDPVDETGVEQISSGSNFFMALSDMSSDEENGFLDKVDGLFSNSVLKFLSSSEDEEEPHVNILKTTVLDISEQEKNIDSSGDEEMLDIATGGEEDDLITTDVLICMPSNEDMEEPTDLNIINSTDPDIHQSLEYIEPGASSRWILTCGYNLWQSHRARVVRVTCLFFLSIIVLRGRVGNSMIIVNNTMRRLCYCTLARFYNRGYE